jgi:tRNA pseudouridine55 synthase
MSGFINVNKAQGVSSAREVGVIKHLSKTPCGHLGTLDPMASGVLPIAIGNAARLFDYFLNKKKTYVATFMFGADSDTLDTTGAVTYGGSVPDDKEIVSVLSEFTGDIMQVPPRYSAKNISGKRGYQLAREGVDFTLPPKQVKVYSFELINQVNENSYSFKIECGGGTYIRSLARDLASRLGTHAVMSALQRTACGIFTIENSVETDKLNDDNFDSFIIPTDSVLPFESVYPTGDKAKKLFNGLSVEYDLADGDYKIYMGDNQFYGLATAKCGLLKVKTKLC